MSLTQPTPQITLPNSEEIKTSISAENSRHDLKDVPYSAPPMVTSFSTRYDLASPIGKRECAVVTSRSMKSGFLLSRTPKWSSDTGVDTRTKGPSFSDPGKPFGAPVAPIVNAFRNSAYSERTETTEATRISMESGSPTSKLSSKRSELQTTPPRSSQFHFLAGQGKFPSLSPKFLFPRPAPKPPQKGLSPVPHSAPPIVTSFSMRYNLDRADCLSTVTLKHNPLPQNGLPNEGEPCVVVPACPAKDLPYKIPSLSPSPNQFTSPASAGSGLARIGAALLDSDRSNENVSIFDSARFSTGSGIEESASDGSITSILGALENLGVQALEIFAEHELGADHERLSSRNSAPAALSICDRHEKALNEDPFDYSKTATMGSWSSWNASFHSTFSNLEQVLQAQGIDIPTPEKICELWTALAISPNGKSGRRNEKNAMTRSKSAGISCAEGGFQTTHSNDLSLNLDEPSARHVGMAL